MKTVHQLNSVSTVYCTFLVLRYIFMFFTAKNVTVYQPDVQ